jgi:hypothetical protein
MEDPFPDTPFVFDLYTNYVSYRYAEPRSCDYIVYVMMTITARLQLLPLATVQNQMDCGKIYTIGLTGCLTEAVTELYIQDFLN